MSLFIPINIISTSIAATASLVLSPLCCRLAPVLGAMDVPRDGRRMHTRPTPRAGGLAIFPAIFIALSLCARSRLLPLIVGGTVIFLAGLYDDIVGLSPAKKLLAQSVAAMWTLALSRDLLTPREAAPVYYILAFLWIVTLINAFNLIDGLDGLCTGVGIFASFLILTVSGSVEGAVIIAALIGFLPINRHPAKMFLGDSGAMLIGFLVSVLSLPHLISGTRGFFSMSAGLAIPFFDTVFSFLRRTASGRSPFSPDKGHFHHRLIAAGLSHSSASRFLVAASAASAAIGGLIYHSGLSAMTVICSGLFISSCGLIILFCLSASDTPMSDRRL